MSDPTPQPAPTPAPAPQPAPTPAPAPAPEPTPGPVPYERFKEVNDAFNAMKARLDKIEADKKAAEDAQLTEQKKWEDLAKKRELELKTEKLDRLRLKVAMAKGLPVEMAERLMGESEEDLMKDADRLSPLLKPKEGPGVPPAGGGGGQPLKPLDISKMSPKEIREKTAQLMAQRK